jgi:hypothetical protein
MSVEPCENVNYAPWTKEEVDLLAAEAADLVGGDGLDEPAGSVGAVFLLDGCLYNDE